jgi:hypothetical protein
MPVRISFPDQQSECPRYDCQRQIQGERFWSMSKAQPKPTRARLHPRWVGSNIMAGRCIIVSQLVITNHKPLLLHLCRCPVLGFVTPSVCFPSCQLHLKLALRTWLGHAPPLAVNTWRALFFFVLMIIWRRNEYETRKLSQMSILDLRVPRRSRVFVPSCFRRRPFWAGHGSSKS